MKAKKLISIVLLAVLGSSTQAQIVSSIGDQVIVTEQVKEKKPKKPRTFKWNIRAGYSFDRMTGGKGLGFTSGFDGSFGISKPFRYERLFWGVEAGYMTYGTSLKNNTKYIKSVISANPRIGIRFPIGQKMSLNLYGGPYLGYRFGGYYAGATDMDMYLFDYDYAYRVSGNDGFDLGINIGAEFFVTKNIFFDLHIKKNFFDFGHYVIEYDHPYEVDEWDVSAFKFVLGIGVQF